MNLYLSPVIGRIVIIGAIRAVVITTAIADVSVRISAAAYLPSFVVLQVLAWTRLAGHSLPTLLEFQHLIDILTIKLGVCPL